jgi:hypothetical protein
MKSGGYAREGTKIFDVKELIGKIFRTKDLASGAAILWGHARRVSFADSLEGYKGSRHRSGVMGEHRKWTTAS